MNYQLEEKKPCPFCKSENLDGSVEHDDGYQVFCCDCGAGGPGAATTVEAHLKWNDRYL